MKTNKKIAEQETCWHCGGTGARKPGKLRPEELDKLLLVLETCHFKGLPELAGVFSLYWEKRRKTWKKTKGQACRPASPQVS